jgi:uncharacterized membrane protein
MTLSEYEQRSLCGIETGCRADDPDFVRSLDFAVAVNRRRRARQLTRVAVWMGSMMVVIGAATARGVLSIGALLAGYGVLTLAMGAVGWWRLRGPQVRAQPGRGPS